MNVMIVGERVDLVGLLRFGRRGTFGVSRICGDGLTLRLFGSL